MSSTVNFFKKLWNSLILHLPSQLVISFFIVYSVFFASFNIWRAISGFSLTFFVFLFFFFSMFLLFFFFLRFPKLFENVSTLIFSDFVWKHQKLITFGIRLMRDWPFVFAIYASLSLSSFYLLKEYPTHFVYYFLYVGCVSFRNIFLLPYLGYSFIVKINEKKLDLLIEKECVSNLPLFLNTSLLENKQFCGNVQNWVDLVLKLKPSADSSKKISFATTPTSVFWFFYPTLKQKGSRMIDMPLSTVENIELKTFPILHNKDTTIPQDWLLKKLAFVLTENARHLNETMKLYQEMGPLKTGLYFKFKPKEEKKLIWYSFMILNDSRDLSYCFQSKLQSEYSHELLIQLTTKYSPEDLPEVAHNLSVISRDFVTEKKIFTPKEDSLDFLSVFKKFFFF